MSGFFSSTVGRKYAMALSAMFLLIFLIMHLSLNMVSVFSENAFNEGSHFMESNPLSQFLMQPILMFAVIFHFVMGFVLELRNKKARPVRYAVSGASANSTWMSRNMMISGGFILIYLVIHLIDFWFPTISKNYLGAEAHGTAYEHLRMQFSAVWRVALYLVSVVLLGLHLAHGFQSSFQSIGARHPKYTPFIKALGRWYSILIPVGFAIVAIYHFISQTV